MIHMVFRFFALGIGEPLWLQNISATNRLLAPPRIKLTNAVCGHTQSLCTMLPAHHNSAGLFIFERLYSAYRWASWFCFFCHFHDWAVHTAASFIIMASGQRRPRAREIFVFCNLAQSRRVNPRFLSLLFSTKETISLLTCGRPLSRSPAGVVFLFAFAFDGLVACGS